MIRHFVPLLAAALLALTLPSAALAQQSRDAMDAQFAANGDVTFSEAERARIDEILEQSHAQVARIFPELAETVVVNVAPVDRPSLDQLGGVTGRADQTNEILIEISQTYPGGVLEAVNESLASTVVHELHHTVRGWTMNGNHYGYGIQIAAINEGLAIVFAERVTGRIAPSDLPPSDIDPWVDEVLSLPRNADYGQWMFTHPDGRQAIGYRTGRWVVMRAMERSGLDVVQLTDLTPAAIWELAGYDWNRQLRMQ